MENQTEEIKQEMQAAKESTTMKVVGQVAIGIGLVIGVGLAIRGVMAIFQNDDNTNIAGE